MLLVAFRLLARVLVECEPAQCAVGLLFIAALAPGFDQGACVVDGLEHVIFQEFVAHAVVQVFDSGGDPV